MTTVLFISEWSDPEAWEQALGQHVPDLDLRVWPNVGDREDVEFALVWQAPLRFYEGLPNLRAIISLGAGVDHLFRDPDIPDAMPLSRIVDPTLSRTMCEYVLAAVLRYHRSFDLHAKSQAVRSWSFGRAKAPADRVVGFMGLGELGAAAAAVIAGHGFSVRGWSRKRKQLPKIDTFAEKDLRDFLSGTEILVNLLPLTAKTQNIVNEETLSCLPQGACFINVGRGAHVDDEALVRHLDGGHLRGATLDAFRIEPLPADHPFWSHPKVLVTPHAASYTDPASAAAGVAENFRLARRGERLLYAVTREREA